MNKRLLLLVCMAAAIWAAVTLLPATKEVRDADPSWPDLKPSAVTSLEIKTDGQTFTLLADQGRWFVTEGDRQTRHLADESKVEALLDFIDHNKPLRRLGDVPADELAQFGLDNPVTTLTAEGQASWSLRLGGQNPGMDGVYAQSSQEKGCLLLDAKYLSNLGRKKDHYLDLRLTELAAQDVEKLRLEDPEDKWEAANQDGKYSFTWPEALVPQQMDESEMDFYLHTVLSLKASAFADQEPAPGAQPVLTLTLTPRKNGNPDIIQIFAPATDGGPSLVRCSRHQDALVLDKQQADKLKKTAFSLRRRTMVTLDLSSLVRQTLAGMGKEGKPLRELALRKTESGWRTEPEGKDAVGMDVFLWRLTDLKYEAEPVKTLPESARLALTWRIYSDRTEPVADLRFFSDPALGDGRCWLKRDGDDLCYPVQDKLMDDLLGQLPPAKAKQP